MAGILVELLLSLLLLKLIEKKGLSVLGLSPSLKQIQQLIVGLFITIILAIIFHVTKSALIGIFWKFNEAYTLSEFGKAIWWMFRSVLYEELIFRGALFYIALKRLGVTKGFWLSVIAFGVYHWFSYSVWNHPVQMILIFLITASAGWMYAYAFLKTNSLFLPIGLHLGWNIVGSIVFSEGSIGKHLLLPVTDIGFRQNILLSSVFIVLYQILVPAFFTWLYVRKMNGEKSYEEK